MFVDAYIRDRGITVIVTLADNTTNLNVKRIIKTAYDGADISDIDIFNLHVKSTLRKILSYSLLNKSQTRDC